MKPTSSLSSSVVTVAAMSNLVSRIVEPQVSSHVILRASRLWNKKDGRRERYRRSPLEHLDVSRRSGRPLLRSRPQSHRRSLAAHLLEEHRAFQLASLPDDFVSSPVLSNLLLTAIGQPKP